MYAVCQNGNGHAMVLALTKQMLFVTETVLPIPFCPCAPKCIGANKVPTVKITDKLLQINSLFLLITTVICSKVNRTRQRRHFRNVGSLIIFVIGKNVVATPQDEAIADMVEIRNVNDSDAIIIVTPIERHVEWL